MGIRINCVSVRLSADELACLDGMRGKIRRGTFLRFAWKGMQPPMQVPSINVEAWRTLARAAANLNQIAAGINAGNTFPVDTVIEELALFRRSLLGAWH